MLKFIAAFSAFSGTMSVSTELDRLGVFQQSHVICFLILPGQDHQEDCVEAPMPGLQACVAAPNQG